MGMTCEWISMKSASLAGAAGEINLKNSLIVFTTLAATLAVPSRNKRNKMVIFCDRARSKVAEFHQEFFPRREHHAIRRIFSFAFLCALRDSARVEPDHGTQRGHSADCGRGLPDSHPTWPGLLETVYEVTLAHELRKRGLTVRRQVPVPIEFDNLKFDEGFRMDLLVEESIIVEIKSVLANHPIHAKQLRTHLALAKLRLGLVLNFGLERMKE